MSYQLTDLGEEWTLETALEGASITVMLYDDATDAIGDTNDVGDITTEPTSGNYARQSASLTLVDVSDDWSAQTDAQVSFDVTDTTETVDSYAILASFTADDTGDGGSTTHLIATGALAKQRDLSQIETLNLPAGAVGFKIT